MGDRWRAVDVGYSPVKRLVGAAAVAVSGDSRHRVTAAKRFRIRIIDGSRNQAVALIDAQAQRQADRVIGKRVAERAAAAELQGDTRSLGTVLIARIG